MRTQEENKFYAIWFGVSLGVAVALVIIRAVFTGQ